MVASDFTPSGLRAVAHGRRRITNLSLSLAKATAGLRRRHRIVRIGDPGSVPSSGVPIEATSVPSRAILARRFLATWTVAPASRI